MLGLTVSETSVSTMGKARQQPSPEFKDLVWMAVHMAKNWQGYKKKTVPSAQADP